MGLLELALGGSRVAEQRGGATELRPLMGRRHTMPKEDHTSSDHSFDDLARALAEGSLSRRGALKLFAGTALAALIPSRALAQQQKVTICHKPGTPAEKTMEVPQSAVDGHLGHGDHPGPCETTTTTTTAAPTTSTTSTTETPTTSTSTSTSTTTPTTSTSTSTTSTSTTTSSCLPNGSSPCTEGSQCCSGNCKSGTCVASCIPPSATPCDPNAPTCPAGCVGCVPVVDDGNSYCRGGVTATTCATSCDCPTGQFCVPGGDQNVCAVVC